LFSNSAVYTVIECVTFSFAETKVLNFNSETKVSDFGLRVKFENLVSANLFCSVL